MFWSVRATSGVRQAAAQVEAKFNLPLARLTFTTMGRTKKALPPPEGSAFAVPLDDGRYSACRVILGANHQRARDEGGLVLVATSAWIGDGIPAAEDPAIRPILRLTRGRKCLSLNWILDELPKSFVPIGTISPTPQERKLPCNVFCVWEGIAVGALVEWRWVHDREAFLAELAASAAEGRKQAEIANQERAAELERLTLDDLSRHTFFAKWPGYVIPAQIRQSRRIMKQTVEALQSLGRLASEERKMEALQKCIEKFNQADERSQFIDTLERDDICDEFYLLCCACGLGQYPNLADKWREW